MVYFDQSEESLEILAFVRAILIRCLEAVRYSVHHLWSRIAVVHVGVELLKAVCRFCVSMSAKMCSVLLLC